MKKFEIVEDLMKEMRIDLYDKIFPHLLASLAGGAKVAVDAALASAAAKENGTAPKTVIAVHNVPVPGNSSVEAVINPDQHSAGELDAYSRAFRDVFQAKMGSKALVLKLLGSVGVT